jgi:hypothetical protein
VYICHAPPGNPTNTQTLQVNVNAVAGHLSHPDDKLGKCGQIIAGLIVNQPISKTNHAISIFPNPGTSTFSFNVPGKTVFEPYIIKITDMYGRLISLKSSIIDPGVKFGAELSPGVYSIEVSNGIGKSVLKWMKL